MTPYMLVKGRRNISGCSFQSVHKRIDTLTKKRYIEVLGIGANGAKVYIPTEFALREIDRLLKEYNDNVRVR